MNAREMKHPRRFEDALEPALNLAIALSVCGPSTLYFHENLFSGSFNAYVSIKPPSCIDCYSDISTGVLLEWQRSTCLRRYNQID